MLSEDRSRLKRLQMRSWRRGTKEMDLVLGPFSDRQLASLSDEQLDAYEAMLSENDIDLYSWYSGLDKPPADVARILDIVHKFHAGK